MKTNESNTDRIIRGIIGLALLLIALFAVTDGTLKAVLIVLGAVALFTAATGFCLIYRLFNFSTKH